MKPIETIAHLIETVHRLRAPDGCPWDRAQTHQSLRPYLIEEAYEVLDILDEINGSEDLKKEKIRSSFREELGDLLLQILLHSEMANETQAFNIYDVAKALDDKLIRRHPHVFGEQKAHSAEHAYQRWEKEKAKEKASRPEKGGGALEGIPRNLPALQRCSRMIQKVTSVGFQWSDLNGPLEKVEEELEELKTEMKELKKLQDSTHPKSKPSSSTETLEREKEKEKEKEKEIEIQKRVESELGDLIFSLCNLAYLTKINPEDALRNTLQRFENRFRYIETRLRDQDKTPEQSHLKEMDEFWNEAKMLEKTQVWGLTGGVAAGKSTVAQIFAESGFPVLDADQIARDLLEKNEGARNAVLKRFGTLDRASLRTLAFEDPQARKDLENILHPLIQKESRNQIQLLATRSPIIIYEASLLIETGRYQDLYGVIVVDAPQEIRMHRLLNRPGITPDIAKKILDSQMPDEQRKNYADFIFENSSTVDKLQSQVKNFILQKNWKII